jgi:hypothetical protein
MGQWVRQQAGQEGWILWSMDWKGATKNDIPQFVRMLSYDFSKGINFLQSSVIQVWTLYHRFLIPLRGSLTRLLALLLCGVFSKGNTRICLLSHLTPQPPFP